MASSPSQPRDATAPPAPARLRLPQLVASSSGLCARRPAARRPSPRPTVRSSHAQLQTASGGPRRQHLPPAARMAACSLPRPVDGGGGRRQGHGVAAGGRRAEAAGAVGCGGPALLRRSGRRPGAPGTGGQRACTRTFCGGGGGAKRWMLKHSARSLDPSGQSVVAIHPDCSVIFLFDSQRRSLIAYDHGTTRVVHSLCRWSASLIDVQIR